MFSPDPARTGPHFEMPDVGIIGLSPQWELRYRPVLQKLRTRIRVRAVYDPVQSRAQGAAADLEAETSEGIVSLVRRPDIRAILVLDGGWHTPHALRTAVSHRKPVFFGGPITQFAETLQQLQTGLGESGFELMPEFSRRYFPATTRLKELLATRLGLVQGLTLQGTPFAGESTDEALLALLDLSQYLCGGTLLRIERTSEGIDLEFRSGTRKGETIPTRIVMSPQNQEREGGHIRGEIRCEHGCAGIEGPQALSWKNGRDSEEETLSSDRSEIEVMLDLFCRRVVGGLIPVPNLEDACRVINWANRVQETPNCEKDH